jgi:hypothetical protein
VKLAWPAIEAIFLSFRSRCARHSLPSPKAWIGDGWVVHKKIFKLKKILAQKK